MLPEACGLGQHFQDLGHSFSPYGPPSRQITYISVGGKYKKHYRKDSKYPAKRCCGSTVSNFQLVSVLQRIFEACLHVTFLYHTASLPVRLAVWYWKWNCEKLGIIFPNFEVWPSWVSQLDLAVGHFASLLSYLGQQKDGESVGEPSFGIIWN